MKVKFLQTGGAAPEAGAQNAGASAQPSQQGNPQEQVMQMAQQIVQQLGPEAAAMLAQAIMEMLQGGGAPQGAPTYAKRGGKLVMIGKR